MSGLRFVEPQWAHALWGLLALVGLLWTLERRGSGALGRLVGAGLQPRLVERPVARRRRLRILLLTLTCALLIVSLMRPQWGVRPRVSTRLGAELMICLDVSRSMLAEDVAPNRLERAKAEVADLLTYLDGSQVGLVAFAGRASVLAPLTPDFGFLHLVLEGVGVHSVTRGGTRLEEPIRKALAGFGPPGAASRAILLITDGEDQDSFPLDAAKQAAELGVRIVAIGFGDEAGSEIYVTEPRSGARTLLRDGAGLPVRSRLDGDLLRQIALVTEGVYVPAGTGLLDLESIFDEHIAPLTRGRLEARGKPVGDDLYQWAILLALVSLVAAVAAPGSATTRVAVRGATVLALGIGLALPVSAIESDPEPTTSPAAASESDADEDPSGPQAASASPREIYNRGVAALRDEDWEEAERWLARSRREARDDGELRWRATYDLGWSLAQRAHRTEAEDAEAALALLREAADWFREAVQLRTEAEDARANLEVVLRRALVLSDRLAQERRGELADRLRELAARQRALLPGVGAVLETVRDDPDVHAVDRLRREFRSLATSQRTLLADADRLARGVWDEHDALETRLTGQAPEERSPEESMRSVQLARVLDHLHRTRDRMGQTRRQLRQRHAERAYRRGAAALEGLKRALDQLADPARVLSGVIEDGIELRHATVALGEGEGAQPAEAAPLAKPAWLTPEFARERNEAVSERAGELLQRLEAAGRSPSPQGAPAASRVVEAAAEAAPLVATAHARLEAAAQALAKTAFRTAADEQQAALLALLDARERFLDLRGLIETTYAEERGVAVQLAAREGSLHATHTAQARNVERTDRLERRLRAEEQQLGDAARSGAAEAPDAGQARERLALAQQIVSVARGEMEEVLDALGQESAPEPDLQRAQAAAEGAVERLEALRRLFLSIVERLRELSAQQLDVADRTARETLLSTGERGAAWGPLTARQTELARRAEEAAWELEEQSRVSGGDLVAEPDSAETARRLRQAGEHVLSAEAAMQEALGSMGEPSADPTASEHQGRALEELEQALALLAPPEPPEDGDGEGPPEPGTGGAESAAARSPSAATTPDPAQLLQQVRDREAQRRRTEEERGRAGYERVEKDW